MIKYLVSLIVFVLLYSVLQILGSVLEFYIFGSGNGISGYEMLIPHSVLFFQLLLMLCIRVISKKNILNKSIIIFIISLFVPLLLFIFQYYLI